MMNKTLGLVAPCADERASTTARTAPKSTLCRANNSEAQLLLGPISVNWCSGLGSDRKEEKVCGETRESNLCQHRRCDQSLLWGQRIIRVA
mmetsp:Transcript_42271/g.62673  ORF Transcript_42271/g.62673 Transcript_42271/m.62673 type:complete len:91 (-) Transcript_42271:41-313(-)